MHVSLSLVSVLTKDPQEVSFSFLEEQNAPPKAPLLKAWLPMEHHEAW